MGACVLAPRTLYVNILGLNVENKKQNKTAFDAVACDLYLCHDVDDDDDDYEHPKHKLHLVCYLYNFFPVYSAFLLPFMFYTVHYALTNAHGFVHSMCSMCVLAEKRILFHIPNCHVRILSIDRCKQMIIHVITVAMRINKMGV